MHDRGFGADFLDFLNAGCSCMQAQKPSFFDALRALQLATEDALHKLHKVAGQN